MDFLQKKDSGFTLIELLVVIGILVILFSTALIAINPAEKYNVTNDTTAKVIASDFATASVDYLSQHKVLPWDNDPQCLHELLAGDTLAQMPTCIHELTQSGKLDDSYTAMSQLSSIYITKCGNSAVLCYNPKSKSMSVDPNTKYDKFGVNEPGCPGNANSTSCYWCKPLTPDTKCLPQTTPTPTVANSPTPTPFVFPQIVPGYANVQSKFLKTYAVFFFDYPGFPPPSGGWSLHLSLNPDFSGDWTQTNKSFGIPSQYGPEGPNNASYTAYRKITMKYVGFASTPANTGVYSLSNCGKTLYYRIANYYSDSATDKKVGPTYTATFDCTTKVGVVDPPLSWYTVYDQLNNQQKQYDASWDFDKNGSIDWVDYWLGAFSTKTRYGGWQPPE